MLHRFALVALVACDASQPPSTYLHVLERAWQATGDANFLGVLGEVAQAASNVNPAQEQACDASAAPCRTPFGAGTCCSADAASGWEAYAATTEKMLQRGDTDVKGAGRVLWVTQEVTTGVKDGSSSVTQRTLSHQLPLFVSKRCQDEADVRTLLASLATPLASCAVMSPVPVLACKYEANWTSTFTGTAHW